jgi:hypothetical protein
MSLTGLLTIRPQLRGLSESILKQSPQSDSN